MNGRTSIGTDRHPQMGHGVYINRIGCAVPQFDFHRKFVEFGPCLLEGERNKQVFRRMADRSQIEHRYTCLCPSPDSSEIDSEGFYRRGAFADIDQRMARFDAEAISLACKAVS